MVTEFQGRSRFIRRARLSLGLLAAAWLVVALPLWLGNRSLLDGVRTLSPVETRLAMPEQAYWDMYGTRPRLDAGPQQAGATPQPALLAMGRGLVCLAENGTVLWEAELEGRTRLVPGSLAGGPIRSLSFSAQPGECSISAWSADGGLLWQRSAQLPEDCLARVDADGQLVLAGNGGQLARLDAAGNTLQRFSTPVDLRYADRLSDGRRFSIVVGNPVDSLRCWTPLLREDWEFRAPQGSIVFAAGDNESIVALDSNGRLYGLDSSGHQLWVDVLPEGIAVPVSGIGAASEFRVASDGVVSVLFFNSSDWMVAGPDGKRLWHGQGYPYFSYQMDVSLDEIFLKGPDGRRCFKSGQDRIHCVDSAWQELWSIQAGSAAEIISATPELILVHENGNSLEARDWDGRQLWRQDFDQADGYVRTVLNSGELSTFRTYGGLLYGIDNSGGIRFRLQLAEHEEYNLAADGRHVYICSSNLAGSSQNWLMNALRDALHISIRFHVDCYDADGVRQWRARLPDRMLIDSMRRRSDGGLAVLATPYYDWSSLGMADYSTWEFVFRGPEN